MFKKSSGKRKSLRKVSTKKGKLNPDVDAVLVPRNSPVSTSLGPQRNPNTTEPFFPTKCWHCENMAKNFLYLESLIRANFNEKCKCQTCSNSLNYLEFVNRNIKKYFGNFDSIVEVAKAFQSEKPDDSAEPVKVIVKKPAKSKKKARTKSGEKSIKENVNSKTKNKKVEKKTIKKSKSIKKVNLRNAASKGNPKKKAVTRVVIKTVVPTSNTTIQ